jgi:hypothetical protein
MWVPFKHYTSSAHGSLTRLVECEKCHARWKYEVSRHVSGASAVGPRMDDEEAQQDSRHRASRNLRKTLLNAIEPAPCPQCGWLQSYMVAHLKKQHHRWLNKLGLGIAALGGGVGVFFGSFIGYPAAEPVAYRMVAIAGGIGLAGIGLVFLRIVLARNLNPNANYTARAGQPSEAVLVEAERGKRTPAG